MSRADEFRVVTHHESAVPHLRVSGDVDLNTAPRLVEALTQLRDSGATDVHLDLREVTFLDSAGIGALVLGMTAGLRLMITGASRPVDRALELAGIAEFLERFDP